MVINGVVNDNLATMSFNEHHYVVKRVTMSFPTLYYLGLEPIFGDYIKENDTLVVAGKLSKRDILGKEDTIYGGIKITKDEECIDVNDITESTKYLKNIDVKTGECFSRLYIDGKVRRLDKGLYSYLKDNSIILVTPNLDKNEFNVFNLKEKLNELFSIVGFRGIENKFNVIAVNKKLKKNDEVKSSFEMVISFNNIDYVKASFIIDEDNLLKFEPFIYSEYFAHTYRLKKNEPFISSSAFPYYFSKSELILSLSSIVNNNGNYDTYQKVFSRFYVGSMSSKDRTSCNSRRV